MQQNKYIKTRVFLHHIVTDAYYSVGITFLLIF